MFWGSNGGFICSRCGLEFTDREEYQEHQKFSDSWPAAYRYSDSGIQKAVRYGDGKDDWTDYFSA